MRSLKSRLRFVQDFPKQGINFVDIQELCAQQFSEVIDKMRGQLEHAELFAGVEARGFIFAAGLAASCNAGFLPVRKAGKLPPPVVKRSYKLEYGRAKIEVARNTRLCAPGVVLVDDVLATGGTLQAAADLLTEADYDVVDIITLIDIRSLRSGKKLVWNGIEVKSLIQL